MSKDDKTTEDEFIKQFEKTIKIKKVDSVAYVSQEKKQLPMIKELPVWFDLNNYKEIYQLDLEGWINQLFLRQQIEGFLQRIVMTGIVSSFHLPEIKKDATKQRHPLIHNITLFEAIRVVESIKGCVDFPPEIWSSPSIFQSMRWDSANNINETSLVGWFNKHSDNKNLKHDTALMEEFPVALNAGIINIDLSAPDNILVDDFKRWLKEQRHPHKKPGKSFSEAALRRWATNQVLPYIDLAYWAKLSGVQIPHWLMGEALLPGSQEGDKVDRIRKTTEPNAEEVMKRHYLYGMVAQLAYETGKHLDIDSLLFDPRGVETKFKILVPVKE